MKEEGIQAKINQRLLLNIGRERLVRKLSSVLSISRESAYRRLRGDTQYSAHEIALIAKNFDLSIDELIFDGTLNRGHSEFYDLSPKSVVEYESFISKYTDLLLSIRSDNCRVWWGARDLSFIHFEGYPVLMSFWTYYNFSLSGEGKKHLISFDEVFEQSGRVYNRQKRILESVGVVTEIWSTSIVESMLWKIKYVIESGNIHLPETKDRLFEELSMYIEDIHSALSSALPISQHGGFFVSSKPIPNNMLLFLSDKTSSVHSFFTDSSFSVHSGHYIVHEVQRMYENIFRKSINISGQSEHVRTQFFDELHSTIAFYRNALT